jgi:DUF917 family protein
MASWTLTEGDIADLADGCSLLGSGGGGEPHCIQLVLASMIAERGPLPVIDASELAADAVVVNVGFVGAPVVITEKLFCGSEIVPALNEMSRRIGRRIDAVMGAEIGGGNGLVAFLAGSLLGVPIVDGDGMGRAFPRSDQVTYSICGRSASPTVVSSEQGDIVCVEGSSNRRVEQIVRALAVANGNSCFTVDYVLSGDDVRACAVLESLSLARRIGAALRVARGAHADPLLALSNVLTRSGRLLVRSLFDGKVVDCAQEVRGGFGFGRVTLDSLPSGARMTIEFQNEFLVARRDGVIVATTPDIISIVDSETLRNIGSESVRYGQRVRVLSIEAPTLLQSPHALCVVGPRAFGFDLDYSPVSKLA